MTSSCTENEEMVKTGSKADESLVEENSILEKPQEQRDDATLTNSSSKSLTEPSTEEDTDSDLDLDFGEVMGASPGLPLPADDDDDLDLDFGMAMGISKGLPQGEEEDVGFGGFGVMGTAPLPKEEEVQAAPLVEEGNTTTTAGEEQEETTKEIEEDSVPGLAAEPSSDSLTVDSPTAAAPIEDTEAAAEPIHIGGLGNLGMTRLPKDVGPPQQPEDTVENAPKDATEGGIFAATANATTATTTKSAGSTIVDTVRKGAVAVAGGTLTAVGLVMIPLPTPCGALVAGSGMALLGTEFEAANRVMNQVATAAEETRDQLIENIEATIEDDGYGGDGEITIVQKEDKKKSKEGEDGSASQDENNVAKKQPGEESSEFVISVNADSYFDPDEIRIEKERKQGGLVNNYIYDPIQNARKRFGVEKKGFLATSVLPLLLKTKQFSANWSDGSGDAKKSSK